jgi:nitrogen fixation protein
MDKRISQLDLVTELDENDVLPIVNNNTTKKVKVSQLIASGGQTNLSYLPDPENGVIDNDNGTSATIPLADVTNAGLFSPIEKTKLEGIETGAQANVNADWNATSGDAQILNKPDFVAQTLSETLALGNTTDGENISVSNGDAIILDNGSMLKKGTIDAGNGGAKGISQICSVGFEHKWEAGRLYIMNDGGTIIREVSHNLTYTPTVTDDVTKGFVQNTRWILDNGDIYVCTDPTEGSAVWEFLTGSVSNLQQVTNAGFETTNPIIAHQLVTKTNGGNKTMTLSSSNVDTERTAEWQNKDYTGIADISDIIPQVNSDWNATGGVEEILNKPTIPDASNFVPYTGATNDLDLGTYNLNADHISLNVSPSGAGFVVGATQWNNDLGSSQTLLKGGNVTLKNGVDLVARIVNKVQPNTTLTKASYQVVRVTGASGQRLAVDLAQANNDLNSADTLGVVTETIATNQEGFILTVGQLLDVNTTGSLQGETWNDGDVLYLSPTTAGRMTNIKPNGATGHIVVLGYVEYAHANQGKIYVKIMNGWELDELHNVFINTPVNNDLLVYETSSDLWKNKSLSLLGIKRNIISEVSNIQNSQNLTQNIVFSQLIQGNTFAVKDTMNLSIGFDKYGSSGTATVRVYLNVGNNLSGAQLLMTFTSATTSRYIVLKRMFSVFSTTLTQGLLSTSSAITDSIASTITSELYSYEIGSPRYLIVTIQQTNVNDTIYTNTINLTN